MKSIIFTIALILQIVLPTWAAMPEDVGSCSSSAPYSGCITIDENPDSTEDGKILLYYQWLEKPQPQRKTFFFLSGGPGGSIEDYLAYKDFWKDSALGQKYNVLFFDPRGVGRSSPINQSNVSRRRLQNYQINNLVSDIEELRQHLLPDQKIGLIGHSFGGHLVFSYATQFPDNVFKLISLLGAASGIAIVSQSYFQTQEWSKVIQRLDSTKLNQLQKKVEAGQACTVPDEKPLPPEAWNQVQLIAYVGFTPNGSNSVHF